FALILAAGAPATAQGSEVAACPELPICAHGAADVKRDGGRESAASDYLLKLDGVKGETTKAKPGKSNGGVVTLQGSSAAAGEPKLDGVVVLGATERDVTTKGQAVMPEMPICGHCGADAPAPTKPKKQSSFSFKFGGVGFSSSGGVSVAAGDVTGDGRD